MAAAQLDLAIIGAGLMGRWHAQTATRLGAKILAVVDSDMARARVLAERFGGTPFGGVEEMLANTRPRVAHVCTPLASHVSDCEQLLEAGCHVMCEKPLAASGAEVARLLQQAQDAGLSLCPVHQFALQSGVADIAARIESLGRIRHIGFRFCSAGAQHLPAHAADAVVLEILPHVFSVLARLFPAHDLAGIGWNSRHPEAGELLAIALFAQAPLSLSVSMSSRPTEASATIAGTLGTAHLDFFHGFSVIAGGTTSRLRKATRPLTSAAGQFAAAGLNLARRGLRGETAYPGLRALFAAFYASIERQGSPPFSAGEIKAVYGARDVLARDLARAENFPEPEVLSRG